MRTRTRRVFKAGVQAIGGDLKMNNDARYCIIGAGAAGLAALKEMREAGFSLDCFEKGDGVGGHWNVDYDALHLTTPSRHLVFSL